MQGHLYGMDSLSAMYNLGWGVPRDEVEALVWELLADAISNSGMFTARQKKKVKARARAAELHRLIELQSAR